MSTSNLKVCDRNLLTDPCEEVSDLLNPEKIEDEKEESNVAKQKPKVPSIYDFIFLKPISRGAFGKVYLGCKKNDPEKIYAIKTMKKDDLFKKNLIKQVITERDALATAHSPFVVNLCYSLQSEQNIYLIMEYMIGGDVKSLLTIYGYFDEDMAKLYIAEVTLALEYLKEHGIVHRDLKPDNMLISNEGHIKLTDFGLSKLSIDVGQASNNMKLSTINYERTPGQILSLKSSLAFSVTASMRKRKNANLVSPVVQRSKHSFRSPLKEAIFNSPLLKQSKDMSPLPLGQIARQFSGSKNITPPIQSLTPKLEDSLNWTTESDTSYMTAHNYSSTKPPSIVSDLNSQFCSNQSVSDDNKVPFSPNSGKIKSANKASVSKSGNNGAIHATVHATASSSQDSSKDDTPQLRLSNESVWNSYAARNLRSMREGSYSEDSGEENGKMADQFSPLFRPKPGKYSVGKYPTSAVLTESYASSSGKSSLHGYHSDDEMEFSSSKVTATRRKRGFDCLKNKAVINPKTGLTGDLGVLKLNSDEQFHKRQKLDPEFVTVTNDSHSEIYAADISCDNSMNDGILRCRECNNTSSEDLSTLETSAESYYSSRSRHQSEMSVRSSLGGNSTMFLSPIEESHDKRPQVQHNSDVYMKKSILEGHFHLSTDSFKSPLLQPSIARLKSSCNCQSSEITNNNLQVSTHQNDAVMLTPDQSTKKQVKPIFTPKTPANLLKTPFQTPFKNQLKTPFRTPKSVRRGPQQEEEERILGTPDYLAPEILMQKPHDSAVDWWALGVCLFEFLTGIPPFNDQTPELVFQNILKRDIPWPEGEEALSEESRAAIEELLTIDQSRRPQAKEVKEMRLFSDLDWDHILDTEPPFVPQPDDNTDTTYFDARNEVQQLVVSAVDF